MPLDLGQISDYQTKKFVVENVSPGTISIGDLNIVLNTGEAQDLLAINGITKKPLRNFEDVAKSRDLELLIVLGKVKIHNEQGEILTQSEKIDLAEIGSQKISNSSVTGVLESDAGSEVIDDRVVNLLQAGSNITLTYDDGANTLTIASSGGGNSALEESKRYSLLVS